MWRRIQRLLATFVPAMLVLAYLALAVCLWNRWDAVVAATLVPVWAWGGAGALAALLCWAVCRRTAPAVLFFVFLASGVGFAEETRSLLREFFASLEARPPAEPEPASLRFATVRCGGEEAPLSGLAAVRPDVVVVQEAPEWAALEALAREIWEGGRSVTLAGGLAILGAGETVATLEEPGALHVRLRRDDGLVLDITNLDLPGCRPRRDMWRPPVWTELVEARIETRRLVRAHLGENPISLEKVHRIVCGGFGTPPGDDVFRPLENSGMLDTFASSGRGWGNTHPAEFPLVRLDQIWVSRNLEPVVSTVAGGPGHRIVVSDVRPARP